MSSQVQFDFSVSTKMIRTSEYFCGSSDHTYQSRFGEFGSERASWNQGWSLEVWFITRSAITRMPRWWASAMNRSNSSSVP